MAAPRMSGKALQAAIIELAHRTGWMVAHFTSVHDSRGFHRTAFSADAKGWPDLFLVRDRALAIEVKGDGDRLRDEQRVWLERLDRAGVYATVITPVDWRAGRVEELLK